ncbi:MULTISPECIES: hypothetical protein [unclassified Rhizobium]|jgi:hypothetical protein|uniref:hypothetical protein n=1 Tax=unclassified Rhizobium TaxID=2613769 RepID=UPI00037B9B56|nr:MULTISPECIES: hypothetical protein [unclassified Rhizobium]MBB3442365.1 hypothetical protein [Rhizobium sp. BK379]MBB3559859.1 hypothetical protein [Rhizobium sp. BK512]
MDKEGGIKRNATETAQRGLWRLMLKLPAMRGRLQLLASKSRSLNDLFEAYEEASLTLERLMRQQGEEHCPMVVEYETICAEIESDIIQYVLEHRPNVPD